MIEQLLNSFVQTMLSTLSSFGYFGIFILMTIESTIIPFPAEIILIPAGALVAQGTFSGTLVLIAATLGSVLGALLNYALAFYFGRKPLNRLIHKYGKFIFIDEKTVLKTEGYFARHGHITTFIGRLTPGIRSFISLPAGFARMNLFEFSLFTALGAGLWSAFLIIIGYVLGTNFESIKESLDTLSLLVIVLSGIIALIYIKRRKRRKANYMKIN